MAAKPNLHKRAILLALVTTGTLAVGTLPAAAHYYTTRCDRDGDDCYTVRCDDDGDDCERVRRDYRSGYGNYNRYYGGGYYGNGYYGNGYYGNRYYGNGYSRDGTYGRSYNPYGDYYGHRRYSNDDDDDERLLTAGRPPHLCERGAGRRASAV